MKSLRPFLEPYLQGLRWLLLAGATGWVLSTLITYKVVGYLFLIFTLIFGLTAPLGATLIFSLSLLALWVSLIPKDQVSPTSSIEDLTLSLAFFISAAITGSLSYRIQRKERFLRDQRNSIRFLNDVIRDLNEAKSLASVHDRIAHRVKRQLKGELALFRAEEGQLKPTGASPPAWLAAPGEASAAQASLARRSEAGWGTELESAARARYVPLRGQHETVGVLAFLPDARTPLTPERKDLLVAIARQLALFIERDLLWEKAKENIRSEESEKLQQTIFNSISHEIRTPLTVLDGFAATLEDPVYLGDPKLRSTAIREIRDNVGRLNRIVGNLLDVSRLSSGHLRPELAAFEAEDLFQSCVSHLRGFLERSSSRVHTRLDPALPPIHGDFKLLQVALENLIVNAVHHSGEVREVELAAESDSGRVRVFVRDRGPGIPEDLREKIFERFFRVPGTAAKGTGLGLYIVRSILDLHKGTITVRPRAGGGSEFELNLPRAESVEEARA